MSVVTVSGGGTTTLYLNVSGSAATNYANDFAAAVGTPSVVSVLSNGGTESAAAGALNIIYSGGSTNSYDLTTPGQYTYVAVGDLTTINGAASDEFVVGGTNLTYIEAAGTGGNRVVFTSGDNRFIGSSTGGTGDTIAGGSGSDAIMTGGGPTTVFSGSGGTTIDLMDTIAGHGDVVSMSEGNTTVLANGLSDTVFASATGTIYGGTGTLVFTTASTLSPLAVTIVGGSGTTNMFGSSNTDLTFSGGGTANFNAGAGNETLDGSTSAGFSFYGDQAAPDANDTVIGGAGTDFFSTGAGTEYFKAGSGFDSFSISSIVGGATITIADFQSFDSVSFAADTVSGTSDGTNFTVSLSDGTKVEFLGITSLPGHTF